MTEHKMCEYCGGTVEHRPACDRPADSADEDIRLSIAKNARICGGVNTDAVRIQTATWRCGGKTILMERGDGTYTIEVPYNSKIEDLKRLYCVLDQMLRLLPRLLQIEKE